MEYEWDTAKNTINRAKHGIGFEALSSFEWDTAGVTGRSRHTDGEARFAAVGKLDGKLFTVIHTWREDRMRIISLRRANKAEEKAYGQKD
jgi:hypothetical protein